METVTSNQSENFDDIAFYVEHLLRPGISTEESQKLYNKFATQGTYDKLHELAKYFTAYDKLMAGVLDHMPNRRDAVILDVGAGTGLIGKRLHGEGFLHVDALDPSPEMLKTCRERLVYRRHICSFFTDKPIPEIADDTYDMLVMCGVCGPGAVPVEAFYEALRILKPGGYIVNCMRAEYLDTMPEYSGKWEPVVKQLTDAGRWRLVSEQRYPNHFLEYEGLRLVYQKL